MKTVNMHEAKTHLSRLVEAAVRGESFVIARAGKPLVRVEALAVETVEPKLFGFLKGEFSYDPDVGRQLDAEIAEMFEASIRDSPLDWGGLDDGDKQDRPASDQGRDATRGAA